MLQPYDKTITQVAILLSRYGFELKEVALFELIEDWLASYSVYWVRLAIVEALYQGRYKAISVEHILSLWKRRGQPTFHFTHDFERLINRNFPLWDLTVSDLMSDPCAKINGNLKKAQESHPPTLATLNLPSDTSLLLELDESAPQTQINSSKDKMGLGNRNLERSIHQFIPNFDPSELYGKLRAVVYQELAKNPDY